MTSVTTSSEEREFIEAEIAVIGVRLAVILPIWGLVVALLDRTHSPSGDPYVANTRMGLWLFLAELLIGTYYVRYTAPKALPVLSQAAFIVSEVLRQVWELPLYVLANLLFRWLFVTLFTGLLISLLGTGWTTRLAGVAGSVSFLITWIAGLAHIAVPPIIRGTHIGSYDEAIHRAAILCLRVRLSIYSRMLDHGLKPESFEDIEIVRFAWGGVDLPFTMMEPHYFLLGTTGSGKTLLIRQLLGPALCPLGVFRNSAIIYDGKREYNQILAGMGVPRDKRIITNPADSRCVAWDLARDIYDREDATNLAHTLIPPDTKSTENPFFAQAVRDIVTEAIMCLNTLSPGKWKLLDVTNALQTRTSIQRLLHTTEKGRATYSRYFNEAEEMSGGIEGTISARFLYPYGPIAPIWAQCKSSFSLVEWMNDTSVLLLGYDANRESVDRINRAILQRASQLICSLPEDQEGTGKQFWCVLDEIRFMGGRESGISSLISFGRTKGARVIIAPQDIDGLYEVFGEHQTDEMLSLCCNLGVLRLQSPKTRDWASKLFGDYEAWEQDTNYSVAHSSGSSGGQSSSSVTHTSGWSRRRVKRESILPSEFFNLPPTSRENGLHGFFSTPQMGAWRAQIPVTFIDQHLTPKDLETSPFDPRPKYASNPQPRERGPQSRDKSEPRADGPRENDKPRGNGRPTNDSGTDDSPEDRLPKW